MPDKNQSILLAGLAMGVAAALASLVPAVGSCIGCLLYLGAGLLAAWHYTSTHAVTISGGQGAGLGAMAGAATVVVAAVVGWLFQLLGLTPSMEEAMQEAVRQMREGGMDPSQVEMFESFFLSPWAWLGFLLFGLIIGAILGALGGAIGAAMFKKGPETGRTADETL